MTRPAPVAFDPDEDNVKLCAYCGVRRAVNRDHVVPKAFRRNRKAFVRVSKTRREWRTDMPDELLATVPACFECNNRKGTRKLVPPSWADKIPALQEAIPGDWRTWDGDPLSPAFREIHT